jgi:hypothetical protein
MVTAGASATFAPVRSLFRGGVASATFAALGAAAQPASPPEVTGESRCPDLPAVQEVLATLLSATEATEPSSIEISDLGSRYRVSVGDRAKTYLDPHRNCAERVRIAAAFIALALNPEDARSPVESEHPSPVAPPDVEAPAVHAPSRRIAARVQAGAAMQSAPELGAIAFGASARAAATWTPLGMYASCAWLSSGTTVLAGTEAAVVFERVPCSVGATLALLPPGDRVELDVDAGAAIGALHVAGRGLATDSAATRLELGGRAALQMGVHIGPPATALFPVIGIEATVLPMAYDFEVTPRGSVGQTPRWWAGAIAGLCWKSD